jgi:hypothetical protein
MVSIPNAISALACVDDGVWTEWTEWECDATCGHGKMTRTRECEADPYYGTYDEDCPPECEGDDSEEDDENQRM